MPSSKDEKSEFEIVLEKYSISEFNLILPDILWKDILLNGIIDKEAITEILNNSKFLMDEKTESWRKLWYYRDLEDVEFKKYLKDVSNKFYNNDYKDQGKLLHVIALLLYFSKYKMYNETPKNIMKKAKENIKNCISSENWDTIEYESSFGRSANGLGFFNREAQNMQEMMTYFKKEIEKSFSIKLKDKAKLLLNDFKNNNLENLEKKMFFYLSEIPILSYMDKDKFVEMLQNLENKNVYDTIQIIMKRYRNSSSSRLEYLLSEKNFWKSISNRILKGIHVKSVPVKYSLLKSFKEININEIQTILENAENSLEKIKTQNNGN